METYNNYSKIGEGRSGYVYRSGNIVKKIYTNEAERRMNREYDSIKLLEKYINFPKILNIDKENKFIYMNYVGVPLKSLDNKQIPLNITKQIKYIIDCLNKEKIFHHDLSLNHLLVSDGVVHLIDFEKSCIDCCSHGIKRKKTNYTSNNYLMKIVIEYLVKRNFFSRYFFQKYRILKSNP